MAYVILPFMQWSRWRRCCFSAATLSHLLNPPPPLTSATTTTNSNINYKQLSFSHSHSHYRNLHFNSNALRLRDAPPEAAEYESDSSEDDSSKSRNEKKREARRAFLWGLELAKFSTTQIKRIINVASLQREVLDAILLVKRLGREARRRQLNLIGKMLREVEPELMNNLLQTTIEGDKTKFEKLFGKGSWDTKEIEDDAQDVESEDDEEDSWYHTEIVDRWQDGLINKDIDITNEVYSFHDVEFDRQELRRLVRRVHSVQDNQISSEEQVEEAEAKLLRAKRPLTRFLRNIAKQIPDD